MTDPISAITAGQPAPDFELPSDLGDTIRLSSLRGAPVVLFFYPRDNTAGCSVEAADFSRLLAEFEALGARVFGISKDSLKSHARFRDKKALSVALLSDENGHAAEDYGVWKEKKMYGKTFYGIERSTFLIDAAGVIERDWRRVKVADHAEAVLDAVRAL